MNEAQDQDPPVSFSVEDGALRARDELEGGEQVLRPSEPPDLRPALTDMFVFPVDRAVSFRTSSLRIGPHAGVRLRDADGNDRGEFTATPREVAAGTHFIEVSGAVKTYVRVADASFTASYPRYEESGEPLNVTFDGEAEVAVGARSVHSSPRSTITVPEDPAAVMTAVSHLGSSIKEFSPERSWPSIRGHPPAIEVSEELRIPSSIERPRTGITITVPECYADVYRVAPLAFYLGATVEAGDRAELRLDNGYAEPLRRESRTLAASVRRILGRCLLLDSLAREGGYYSQPRYEYEELSPDLPFYPHNVYDASLTDQLMEYLEVPWSALEPYLPRWRTAAVLRPTPADAELVPHLVNRLAPIDVAESPGDAPVDADPPRALTRGYAHHDPPAGTTKLIPTAFEHGLSQTTPAASDASAAFLTADRDRAARLRDCAAERGDDLAAATAVIPDPDAAALRDAFGGEYEVVYCDLPAPDDGVGFDCADGVVRPSAIDVSAPAVALAGRDRRDAATALVGGGAVAAAVAPSPTASQAVLAAELLLAGQPIAESVRLAGVKNASFVGDAAAAIARQEGGPPPLVAIVDPVTPDEYDLTVRVQPSERHPLGSVYRLAEEYARNDYGLIGASARQPFRISASEVATILGDPDFVALLDGETYHGEDEVSAEDVRDVARRAVRTSD
ncbi:hypothetical protein G9464_02190 [Halostella sp. JP-L12]|uniref:hypothetical protein n=1 Tax=Halostella TaxID=1843185 RepID=UPI000EF795AC|nr:MULTISPECIES: hypothetical protein [Halostella]NHN46411.1 hypothetical protein [Halostella sp. JP-L12]